MPDSAWSVVGLVVLLPLLAWQSLPQRLLEPIRTWLASRWAPLVAGGLSGLALWWCWRGLTPVEVVHDETAYLLQAAMLARGHLAGPPRPLAEFFEQFQVLAQPVLAVKYPPGFALSLVPGVWLGLPGLMAIVLTGLTGGLIFALGRRLAGPAVALLTWGLWLAAPGSIPFRQLLMSETLTGALWLVGWWCLLEWWSSGATRWLATVAAAAALVLIARPLTGVAYALPIAGVVIWRAWRSKQWRAVALGCSAAIPVLLILGLQNRIVTGRWTRTAWSEYTRVYAPSDHFGFGTDSTPPLRPLPPDFLDYVWYYGEFHKEFTPGNVPHTLKERGFQVLHDVWGTAAPAAAILAGLGLAAADGAVLLAAATALLLLIVHSAFAHPPEWSIYYMETWPVLLFLSVLGTGRAVDLFDARFRSVPAPKGAGPRREPALVTLGILILGLSPHHLSQARTNHDLLAESHRSFRARVAALPGRTIVFVHYSPNHIFHRSQISNPEDLGTAPSWIVYDRGPDNARLMAMAPDRRAYRYFERGDSLVAWRPDGSTNR